MQINRQPVMKTCKLILILTGGGLLTSGAEAQTVMTNLYFPPPATRLEAVEATVGNIVIKGRTEVGSVTAGPAVITVFCKEDIVGDSKEHGLLISVKTSEPAETRALVDYDELESLTHALDYLSRIDWSVTSMGSFDASYTTKAGLRVDSFSSRRSGKIEFALRTGQMTRGIVLAPEQLAQIRSLVEQAKRKLDDLRKT